MKHFHTGALLALGVALLPWTAQAAPKAKITPAQAASAAKMKIPGKVIKTTYEFEDGHWQYAVLITNKSGQMYEVEVSSVTGKVTDTEKTSAAEEAAEAAADKKAAGGKNAAGEEASEAAGGEASEPAGEEASEAGGNKKAATKAHK